MIGVGGRKLPCIQYVCGLLTVVLISGFETTQDNWNPGLPALAAQATVVTYGRPGVGKSEIGVLPSHGEQSARDLRALLQELAVPRRTSWAARGSGPSRNELMNR